ncbi:MAG: hypothetical protein ACP5HU_08030 [Phycisphaerae bacterium]
MAKASPLHLIEQHVEKGVLAVSGLIFLFVLAHWGLSSPRRIEIVAGPGGPARTVSPTEVDAELRQAAAEIRRLHMQAEPEPVQYGNLAERVRSYRNPSLENYYPGISLSLPRRWAELPMMDERETSVDLESLVQELAAPNPPQINVNRVLPQKSDPRETWVAHVAAVYPWGQVVDRWQQLLRGTRIQPRIVVLGVEAEVQQRRPDGQWSQPRTVQGVVFTQQDGSGATGASQEAPRYDGTNARQVREAIDTYFRSRMARVMEPEYWPIYHSPARQWIDWRVNLPETSVSRLAEQDDAETDGGATDSRFGDLQRERFSDDLRRERFADYERPMMDGSSDDLPRPTPVPPLSTQIDNGSVLVWLHEENLQSNRFYRYRVRLRVLNPLYTWDQYAPDEQTARQSSIHTPFSEWSEELEVPRDVQFFLTGALPPRQDSDGGGRVVVTVFRHSRGQVVRYRFTVSPGDPIGRVEEVPVIDPLAGGEAETPVDFSTGAVAIDFDFGKRVLVSGMERETVEMLYLDELGRMNSRVLLDDRDSQSYRDLRSRAERTETEVPGAGPGEVLDRRPDSDIRRERFEDYERMDRREMRERMQ